MPHSLLHHGNKGRVPPNTFNFDDVNRLTSFMVNYDGMPLPGRVPGHRDKVMVLPRDITKSHVFTKYRDACLKNGWTAAGRSKVCLPSRGREGKEVAGCTGPPSTSKM